MKVLVAMSGGVDSSVAAALIKAEGHHVVGVTLKQWQEPDGSLPTAGCCTVADAEDARRVAAQLDIPYYVLDYVEEFSAAVVAPFGRAYRDGRTPNPCVDCNRTVRFRALLERASQLGCEALATGHHARVVRRGGRHRLMRGCDPGKDQSYVLYMLGQPQLSRLLLPIGDLTKDEVRAEAARLGLRTAAKPDSQDICFVGGGDYRQFLRRHAPEVFRPGRIVDGRGRELGRHDGTAGFTIGQRRGVAVDGRERRYVVAVDVAAATVTLGSRAELAADGCLLEDVTFTGGQPPARRSVEVKVRYRSPAVPARLEPGEGGWEVWFDRPVEAIAPGQAAVIYRGDEVLGGGTIRRELRA